MLCVFFFFFKQKTAYEMRIIDCGADVCSSGLGRDPLFLQGVAEPVGIIASVCLHPLRFGQTVEQSGCASVIADLPSGHEEADRTTIRIGHSMQLGVHAALRAADQASRTPLFTPRLDAVRCALR